MPILFYLPGDETIMERMHSILQLAADLHGGEPEVFTHLSDLEHRLLRSLQRPLVVVLHVADQDSLRDLSRLERLLEDVSTILILPDTQKNTLRVALRLRPSYYASVQDDFQGLAEVLKRVARRA